MAKKSKAVLALEAMEDELRSEYSVPKREKLPAYSLAWMKLFRDLGLLPRICEKGFVRITPTQIKDATGMEPRIIAKHDFGDSRPWIFRQYGLSILPLSRSEYLVGKFNTFEKFPLLSNIPIKKLAFPSDVYSIDYNAMTSEAVQLNAAFIAGAFNDFLGEDSLRHTLSGRMTSESFEINIPGLSPVAIAGTQMEIDGGYEGKGSLAIVEAKNKLSPDFNTRQLYYPFRRFNDAMRVGDKSVRNVYQVFSDGVFNLYEYIFTDPLDFTSIQHVKTARYVLDSETISIDDLKSFVSSPPSILPYAGRVMFPQADTFERVVNLCEVIAERGVVSKEDIYLENAFTPRQADYYSNAGIYLGLLADGQDSINLTHEGLRVMRMESIKERKLAFASLILAHAPFRNTFKDFLESGNFPNYNRVVMHMENAGLSYAESTLKRRSLTVISWCRWIADLVQV